VRCQGELAGGKLKGKINMKLQNLIHILIGIVCVGLLPDARAVVPPPDGGYPGGNTAEGQGALFSLTSGTYNTAAGLFSLRSNTTGSFSTGVGAGTLALNNGDRNTATGAGALLSNTIGVENTANGALALLSNSTGVGNMATGATALFSNTTGTLNTAVGAIALSNNTNGSSNIALGVNAGFAVTTADNVICIGSGGVNDSNSWFIGQIFGRTSSGGTAVFINSNGRLGTVTSSRRYKEKIEPMERASEALLALKPVTFRYKKEIDSRGIPQFGLVAEEVEAVNPDLVVRDKEGKVNTVRYDAVNAMLLNEFLKEHKKVEEQEATIQQLHSNAAKEDATINDLKKDVQVLTAQIKDQAAQIEKVSAQLEMVKPAPQVVAASP
jgi:hypothetical protein